MARQVLALVDSVQRYYQKTSDYTADFLQTYSNAALSRDSESRGTLQLKRPGRVRWAYAQPTEKLFLIDGKQLWMTDPENEQVMVDANFRSSELLVTVRFLWGEGKLTDNFTAKLIDSAPYGCSTDKALELTPKTGATYAKVVLLIDPRSGEVKESILYETVGNTNRFKFTNVKLNSGLQEQLFTFTPPTGWAVIQR